MRKHRKPSVSKAFGTPGRRTRDTRGRTMDQRTIRPRILIVCEGGKTEPNYFLAFDVTNDVYGRGLETIRVVEEAIRLNENEGPFDQIWCVFDRDGFPPDDFDNAIHKLESLSDQGFHAAFSNEAFELWYILHFEFLQSGISRDMYCSKLKEYLGGSYDKGDRDNYEKIQSRGSENDAIRNAEKLLAIHAEGTPYSRRCPMTTVHELVKELRRVQRESGF